MITEKQTVILNQLAGDRKELVAFSRFFNNDSVELNSMKQESYDRTNLLVKGKHVLCIQDTTEINYQRHLGKLSKTDTDLGLVGNNKDIGFFLHPSLVVDSEDSFPLGLSWAHIWNRPFDKIDKNDRNYSTQPIEEKESYRWITNAQNSKDTLSNAEHITVIGDRESDIYEEFIYVPDSKTDILVRSRGDRNLYDSDDKLFETLSKQTLKDTYTVTIKGDKRINRKKREALLEVRFCKVKIKRPLKLKSSLPSYIELTAIEVRENQQTCPNGETPILWRLLTTYNVLTFENAKQIIGWYKTRWLIEELFRILKRQGLNIEASQLETGIALKKLTIMSLQTAIKILQLRQDRNGDCSKQASLCFTEEEIEFAEIVKDTLEGKTKKQKNNYDKNSLAWMCWVIARLGGWKGYQSESPPGPITMKRGLDKFNTMITGWLLASKKDVCIE